MLINGSELKKFLFCSWFQNKSLIMDANERTKLSGFIIQKNIRQKFI